VPEDKISRYQGSRRRYGRSQVLFGVTLNVPWRGGVAILGRNGAGKTTLMKAIVGELRCLADRSCWTRAMSAILPTEQRIHWELDMSARACGIRAALVRDKSCGRCHDKSR